MARSVGITISAIVVFVGCAFTLLFGGIAALGLVMTSLLPTANMPTFVIYFVIVEAAFAVGFSGWGIASGVGLINTKEWARISMIVFAAILAFFTIPAALLMGFVPLPTPKDPNLPSNFALMLRVGIVFFYGALGALAVFWLYFFNRASIKAQFEGKQWGAWAPPVLTPVPTPVITPFASVSPLPSTRIRPLSITIIAWFLIVCSAFTPLSLLYSRAVFRNVAVPFCFLGLFLAGGTAMLVALTWMVVQVAAAVGLLKLQNWAWLTTIGLQLLGILNVLLLVAIPANRARFQHIMDAAMASMSQRMPQPISFSFPVWMGMIGSLPILVVILWFLITRRQAFTPAR